MIKQDWDVIGQEPLLAITWDKTNDVIFLKTPKCLWAIFDHFWSFLRNGFFFKKIRLCDTQLCMAP